MTEMMWSPSHKADKRALPIADRHYSRQKVGSPQYVAPGAAVCLICEELPALWVTSWPKAEYVRHRWAGAWVNTLFRNEGKAEKASELITAAVQATRSIWEPPPLGIVSFVDPKHVPGVMVRGERIYGFCYLKAGWRHVGFTKKEKQWAWQQLPEEMPPPLAMLCTRR